MSNTINYKGNEITIYIVTHRMFDAYINGIPRICRNTPSACIVEAKQIIDREGKAK